MKLDTSYRQILTISLPIMLGSAVQNIIALSDSVFLYHLSEVDFAAIGFVGVFYLIIAAIGFGFSKGGQILIARRMGERDPAEVGRTFYAMLYFELGLALIMFLFMQYGTGLFFAAFVNSDIIYEKSLEYIEYRSFGVFFSYAGVAIIALYTGVARTWFIVVDTLILAVVNIVLNYGFIFGNLGLPEMGIAGAGLASSIAEGIAFICFFIYILFDKKARLYGLFRLPKLDWEAVIPIIWKTAKMCLLLTVIISIPVIFFPEQILYPLLGGEDMSLIRDSQTTLYVLFGIITLFSVGGVFFNGLVGTGATMYGLKIQAICAVGYLIYIYVVVEYTTGGLEWAWASEIFYWIIMTGLAWMYLKGNDWHRFKF